MELRHGMAVPVGEGPTSTWPTSSLHALADEEVLEMNEPDGDVVSPEVLPKKKRPSPLTPNPDYGVQQQMDLMTKAAAERAAARAIEKQSEEDCATKRRKADREYLESI